MKRKNNIEKQVIDFRSTLKIIIHLFGQIQQANTLNKSHIFQLVKIHKQRSQFFDKCLEQVYLKIFKCFHEKANKKIPSKFQNVLDLFFKELLKQPTSQAKRSLNFFTQFLSEAIYSSIMNVRIMASRILFVIIKGIPLEEPLDFYLQSNVQDQVARSVHYLLRQKVSTYRQLGIKLCSLTLNMSSQIKLSIQNQLFKILAVEENQFIRKMVITNMPFTQNNIERVLIRLRDKNAQIRATLLRRLVSDKFRLENMKLNCRYKILYDGFGTKDIISKEEALRYFASFFKSNQMEEENKFLRFIQLFQPNLLLVNSHLYVLFNKLIGELLALLPSSQTLQYIRKLCLKVKSCIKEKQINISNQLIWLKNASVFKDQLKQVNNSFEEFGPSGVQLSNVLLMFLQRKNIFAINQFLQLFSNMKMPDQIGRNKMFDTLKQTLLRLPFYEVPLDFSQINKTDDICNTQTRGQMKLKKFMLSYYDIPIISDSTDLIIPIVAAMKSLRQQTYVRQLQQTISEWSDPQSTLFKEKLTTQLNLKRLQTQEKNQRNNNLLKTLTEKFKVINSQIEFQNQKTLCAISALSKLKHDWNVDPYLNLIQNELKKDNKSQGIYLLGLYCLQRIEKVALFFPLFWYHIMNDFTHQYQTESSQYEQNKQHLLISLKVMTDFMVKFDILNSEQIMNNTTTQESSQYNSDKFMERITFLILNKDPQIRIFSIQCLCRMIYHNRIDQNNISTYFLYLLLLWWETNTQEISSKSVHTISLFFRSYIEKGNEQVTKLAQMLCIFHKILKIFEQKNKTINKKLIVYNLKINQFIKKTAAIATTVLKYYKQKKTIWHYEQAELGPQQFFLLYLLYQPGFHNILEKPLNICDFYNKCPLQTLIYVKKKIQKFQQLVEQDQFFPKQYKYDKTVTKKSLQQLSRFEKQLQNHISVKNQQTFNEEIIHTLQKIFVQSSKYINEEAKRIAKNIQDQEIFINMDSDYQDQSADQMEYDQDSQCKDNQDSNHQQQESQHAQSLKELPTKIKNNKKLNKIQENQNSFQRANKITNSLNSRLRKKQQIIRLQPENQQNSLQKSEQSLTITKKVQIKGRKRVPNNYNKLSLKQQLDQDLQGKIVSMPTRSSNRLKKRST